MGYEAEGSLSLGPGLGVLALWAIRQVEVKVFDWE